MFDPDAPKPACETCLDRRYVIHTTPKGRQMVIACGACSQEVVTDQEAGYLARRDGIECEASVPCFLTGLLPYHLRPGV